MKALQMLENKVFAQILLVTESFFSCYNQYLYISEKANSIKVK